MEIRQAIEIGNINLRGLNVAKGVDFVDSIDKVFDNAVCGLNIALDA